MHALLVMSSRLQCPGVFIRSVPSSRAASARMDWRHLKSISSCRSDLTRVLAYVHHLTSIMGVEVSVLNRRTVTFTTCNASVWYALQS